MRIDVNQKGDVVLFLSDVFNGVTVRTDDGDFGICQRDGGIEIMHQGKLVWHSNVGSVIGEKGAP